MSLVVAGVHDRHITMVADTKVSFYDRDGRPDDQRTRHTYFEAFIKVVVLRSDLLVGITGDDPDEVMKGLVLKRERPVEEVLDHLKAERAGNFVLAALDPLRLFVVTEGEVDDRTVLGRAWAGDAKAYELFQARSLDSSMVGAEPCFKLTSSMQWLTSFDPVSTVGGTTIRVTSKRDGFRFTPMFTQVGPHHMEVESATVVDGVLQVTLVVPRGVDGSTYQTIVVPGECPTPGAVGLLIPETGRGLVFAQDRPWEPTSVDATSVEGLAEAAAATCGQTLMTPRPPTGHC